MKRIALAPARQRLQHDRGAAQGQETAPENRLAIRQPDQHPADRDQQQHAGHLERAAEQENAPGRRQVRERELDADREQQQHHADLCHDIDLAEVRDQVQPIWSDQRAGR